MLGYNNKKTFAVAIGDPTGDRNIALVRAPEGGMIVESLWAIDGVGLTNGNGTGISLTIYNGGTVGTAQTVVGSAVGGTTVAWTAQQAKTFSLSANVELTEGEYLWVAYEETGTIAPFLTIGGTWRTGSLS